MDRKKIVHKGVDLLRRSRKRDLCQFLVNMAMNISCHKASNFLTGSETTSFSRLTLLHAVISVSCLRAFIYLLIIAILVVVEILGFGAKTQVFYNCILIIAVRTLILIFIILPFLFCTVSSQFTLPHLFSVICSSVSVLTVSPEFGYGHKPCR